MQRKLLLNFGLLILLMVGLGIGSTLVLQHVLAGLDSASRTNQVERVASEFRWVVLIISASFLLIVNVTAILLVRMAVSIVRTSELRQMEVLHQVAVAVNHELNNSLSTIDLQLRLVGRRAADCPGLSQSLCHIDQSLQRITSAVQSLRNVRRIVLTDYLPGTKMLDLQRSSELEPVTHEAHS